MKLILWERIIALRAEIGSILERTLLGVERVRAPEALLTPVDEETLGRLRSELRTRLDSLKDSLLKELTEAEVYLAMFPLVLLCDEMVMARLPKLQQTLWFLLQSELFQINYGGDVFYDFIDERLQKPDTPPMVFEVLYYCLSAGFVGKFGFDGSKVQRYKALLCERIPGALPPRKKRRRREPGEPEPITPGLGRPIERRPGPRDRSLTPGGGTDPAVEQAPRGTPAFLYYVAALLVLLVGLGVVLGLSNL
ncbi:MAG: DotU family type IV/VI secretion system protein [Polyangia bacterium]